MAEGEDRASLARGSDAAARRVAAAASASSIASARLYFAMQSARRRPARYRALLSRPKNRPRPIVHTQHIRVRNSRATRSNEMRRPKEKEKEGRKIDEQRVRLIELI